MSQSKICKRCNLPVIENADQYEVFESMHWLCFHLEFEHEGDPDVACGDPSCPWWHIAALKRKLVELGFDPEQVLLEATKEKWKH
jgi:hypothetical protein